MTLPQLLSADLATQRQYALVFGIALKNVLRAKWEQFGTTNCVPEPRQLTDGRWMLSADVLSEVDEGKLLGRMWANSDKAQIAAGVTITPWAEAVALLPPDEPL